MFAEPGGRGAAVSQALDDGHDVSDLPEGVLPDPAVDLQLHRPDARRISGVLVQIPTRGVQLLTGRQPVLLSGRRMPAVRTVGHIAVLLQWVSPATDRWSIILSCWISTFIADFDRTSERATGPGTVASFLDTFSSRKNAPNFKRSRISDHISRSLWHVRLSCSEFNFLVFK